MQSDDERAEKRRARTRAWREANPEKWQEIRSKYQAEHKADRAAYGKAWRLANPDKVKEQLAASAEIRSQYAKARYAADPERYKAAQRERQKRPDVKVAARRRLLATKYGMSLEEYTERGEAQGWVCVSCKKVPGQLGLVVDHDHATGKVRGLLCGRCNSALGLLDDDLHKVQNLATYMRKYERENPPSPPEVP